MTALALIVMLTLAVLVAPFTATAQQPTKVHRIGWLGHDSPPSGPNPYVEAFQQGLRDLGYVEGQNITIEYRYTEGNVERLPALAAELVGLHVDVIVTSTNTAAAFAAKQTTSTLPIIMAGIGADPFQIGPGGRTRPAC